MSASGYFDVHRGAAGKQDDLFETYAVVVQEALAEHTLSAAPKKAKKFYFEDPFIFHAVERMLEKTPTDNAASLAETVAVTHFGRKYGKIYYIKGAKGEVDIAYIQGPSFIPGNCSGARPQRAGA